MRIYWKKRISILLAVVLMLTQLVVFPQITYANGVGDVTKVAAGGYHNLALRSDGTVWA